MCSTETFCTLSLVPHRSLRMVTGQASSAKLKAWLFMNCSEAFQRSAYADAEVNGGSHQCFTLPQKVKITFGTDVLVDAAQVRDRHIKSSPHELSPNLILNFPNQTCAWI